MRRLPKNLGVILLAIWLILIGAFSLFHVTFTGSQTILDILAIAAGILLLIQWR